MRSYVARADPEHALALGVAAHLAHVARAEALDLVAVVQLGLLRQRQVGVGGLLETGEHGPQGRDLQRVRGDELARVGAAPELAPVDAHLVGDRQVVGHVDLDRPVPEGLHQLVALELAVLGLVGVPQDHLVDVGLGELLRLDRVLLGGAQEVVEEGHVQLQHLDELEQAAVRHVELAVEVEGPRVRVRAVLGDLAVVDVPRQLGRVLVLLVLGLEGADPQPVALRQHHPLHAHALGHLPPVALEAAHQDAVVVAAHRIELALDRQAVGLLPAPVQALLDRRPGLDRDQEQGVLVHGRAHHQTVLEGQVPLERVERPLVRKRVALQPALEQPRDGALGRSDRPVEQQDAPLGPEPLGARPDGLHQLFERAVQSVDRVPAPVERIVEEPPAPRLPGALGLLRSVVLDHVDQALPGVARDRRLPSGDLEVLAQRALPGEGVVSRPVVPGVDQIEQGGVGISHRGVGCQGHRRGTRHFPVETIQPRP